MRPWGWALPLAALLAAGGCGRLGPISRIVLVTLDTTRADRLGCYGHGTARTPNLDALAEEGVLFENAVSPSPTTLPSHATMFTGQYPVDHGARYNLFYRLAPSADTLAETLKRAGFVTAGYPASQIIGSTFGLNQGFDTYVDPPDKPSPDSDHPVAGMSRSATEGVDLALGWLEQHGGQRLFLWLHFYDPHWPYAPPFPFAAEFRDRPYEGEIAYMDAQLGRLLAELRRDDDWSRTLVVVAGDHGEGLYDHGERWHSILTYETTQHVPLIVRVPGARPSRVAEPVTLADLMPTILDLAAVPAPGGMRGESLRGTLSGDDPPRRALYFESMAGAIVYGWQELHGIRDGRFKLINSTEPELYDLGADPGEATNLALTEPERLRELRESLAELERPAGLARDPQAAQQAQLDPETEAMLASLGYVGGSSGSSVEGAPHPKSVIDLEPELLSAQAAVAARQWSYVEDLCRYALGRDPTNRWALTQMVMAQLNLGRIPQAMEHAQILVKIYPEAEESYQTLAEVYMKQGRPQQAYEALERGLAVKPDSELLKYSSLVAAFESGRGDAICREDVVGAVAQHPGSPRLRVLQARCEARAGNLTAALESLRASVERGFKRLAELEQAKDFAALARLPGFQELLSQAATPPGPAAAGSRQAG